MKTTHTVILGFASLLIVAGCSGSDDPQANQPSTSALQCGSAALFSQSHEQCDAMDASGVPGNDGIQCRCLIGYKWDGNGCVGIGGCQCAGTDCNKLSETQEACEQAHDVCADPTPTFTCGSNELFARAHDACAAMDVVATPGTNGNCFCMLGYAWNGSSCEALTNCQCVGADCDKLTETQEACEQNHSICGKFP